MLIYMYVKTHNQGNVQVDVKNYLHLLTLIFRHGDPVVTGYNALNVGSICKKEIRNVLKKIKIDKVYMK